MQRDSVTRQIRAFILENFPLARKREIRDDGQLLGSGIVDSLGVLEVVAFVEREFQITVNDEELLPENFHSIDCITTLVERKRSGAFTCRSEA